MSHSPDQHPTAEMPPPTLPQNTAPQAPAGMALIRRVPLPHPTKPALGFPSSQMLMSGFLFGALIALLLGAADLAAPLGIGTAILFGAVDI